MNLENFKKLKNFIDNRIYKMNYFIWIKKKEKVPDYCLNNYYFVTNFIPEFAQYL